MAQRLIVFETDELGCRTVVDIMEHDSDNLKNNLRRWKRILKRDRSGLFELLVERPVTNERLYVEQWHTDKRISKKGQDNLNRDNVKAWNRRQLVRTHNGLLGDVGMARQMCRKILDSATTTEESKNLAVKISAMVGKLGESLKTRAPWKGALVDDPS